jgi:murein DD-endopeptidase MepM/ murein hydrolase activator NlpD
VGRHSAPAQSAPPTFAAPVSTGPRHARSAPRRAIVPSAAALRATITPATIKPAAPGTVQARHRAAAARPAPANRAPLWLRSPAVPAAVAVLAVWSAANLPHLLSTGHSAPASRAASVTMDGGALAAAGIVGAVGGPADGSPSDATTVSAAARLAADGRVSRQVRAQRLPTATTDSAAAAAADGLAVLKFGQATGGRPPATPPTAQASADGPAPSATAQSAKTQSGKAQGVRAQLAKAHGAKAPGPKAQGPTASAAVRGHWVRPSAGAESSCFCMRWGVMHEGIDLAGPLGSPILAVGDGVVVEAGPAEGFGMWVVIRHANGDYSIYGHMYHYYVKVGEHVRAGQHIADIGANGQSTGPHLHFGVSHQSPTGPFIDPVPWLAARGVKIGPYNPEA